MRNGCCALAVMLLALSNIGCGLQEAAQDAVKQAAKQALQDAASKKDTQGHATNNAPVRSGDAVTIASFNIQVFGTSKLGKTDVMQVLADVVQRYDVVAIQELRSKDQTVVPQFVEQINAAGRHYDYVVGPRLGRTSSKEQYVYIYDTQRLELNPNSVYTVPDPDDYLHREPLCASFRVRGPPAGEAFSFTLVNIHTDPDETDIELDALADAFTYVQRQNPAEDDVILLGDLNVDEYHLGRLGQLPGIQPAITGVTTNTRGNHAYDNLVFNTQHTSEYTGQFGVLDLMSEYNLTMDQALDVSDHLPVWGVFSARESNAAGPIASRPSTAR